MNAAQQLDPTPTLTVQRGGLATTQPAKMDFYKLQNHFWQLDAQERFSGNETRLYFYWLNRFNAGLHGEYWPDEYPRWGQQVQADLGLTDKTLAAARKVLVARGLLSYREGTKTKAAVWGLGIIRNNSGQSTPITRNISEQSAAIPSDMSRNNSGQSAEMPSHITRKNSGLYKEKTEDSSRVENTHQKNAGAGEAEISPSAESKKEVTAPTPLPPAPAPAPAVGTVAPCLAAGTDESRALAEEMATNWAIPLGNARRRGQFHTFTRTLNAAGRLAEVRTQFEAYRRYQQLRGISRYAIDKYLGHELEGYEDGEWCGSDWLQVLAEASQQAKPKGQNTPEAPARASVSRNKQQSWS